MLRENLIKLQNGAVIAFEEYGDANGEPVIFCHGWPSSRIMARLTDDPARDLGIRIISPDRPGISGSSLQPDRKLTDWPRLVERITDHLAIYDFRMLAISGGAPYAYATAAAMPERVRAIAIVGGAPPIAEVSDTNALLPLYRWMLALYRTRPRLLRRLFYLARPILSLRPPVRLRPLVLKMLLLRPCDAESLRTQQRSKPFLKASGAHGEVRLKASSRTSRSTPSRGGLHSKMCAFQFDYGMGRRTGLFQFTWPKNSQSVCPTARRGSLMVRGTIHCPFATCAKSLRT